MGCGKSSVGRALADELGWCFYDLDQEVEATAGCAISEIFDTRGEALSVKWRRPLSRSGVANVRTGRSTGDFAGGRGGFPSRKNVDSCDEPWRDHLARYAVRCDRAARRGRNASAFGARSFADGGSFMNRVASITRASIIALSQGEDVPGNQSWPAFWNYPCSDVSRPARRTFDLSLGS